MTQVCQAIYNPGQLLQLHCIAGWLKFFFHYALDIEDTGKRVHKQNTGLTHIPSKNF